MNIEGTCTLFMLIFKFPTNGLSSIANPAQAYYMRTKLKAEPLRSLIEARAFRTGGLYTPGKGGDLKFFCPIGHRMYKYMCISIVMYM